MAINTALDFKKKFDLDLGKFILTDITDYTTEGIALADVVGIFKIIDPNGNIVYENTNFGSPDIDADVSLVFNTVSIPKDAAGNYILGVYSFTYQIQVIGAVQPGTYSKTETFDLCKALPTVSITHLVDCFCSKLTSTDGTDYSNSDADSVVTVRTHTIIAPSGSGIANTVTALATKDVTPIVTKTWATTISTLVTWNFGDDVVEGTVTGNKEVVVNCDVKLCDVYCCIKSLNDQYELALVTNKVKANDLFDKLERVVQLIALFDQAVKCGKLDTDGNDILDKILEVGDCTDQCKCSDGVDPVEIVPLCGGAATGVVTVVAGAGIQVTAVPTGNDVEYTVAMNPTDKTKLDGLKNQEIQTDTPTEIEILHPGGNPDVWKVNQKAGAIPTPMDALNFRLTMLYDTAGMTYTFEEIKTQGSAFKTSGIVIEGVNELAGTYAQWLGKSACFKIKSFLVNEVTPIKFKPQVTIIDYTRKAGFIGPKWHGIWGLYLEQYIEQPSDITFNFRILAPQFGMVWSNNAIKNTRNPIILNILITG